MKVVGGEVVARRCVRVVEGRVRGVVGRVMPRGEGLVAEERLEREGW